MNAEVALLTVCYALALWLGLYLVARDLASPRLRFAGMGLVAVALGLAGDVLLIYWPESGGDTLVRLRWPLLLIPAWCWFGVLLDLLPTDHGLRKVLPAWWPLAILVDTVVLYLAGTLTPLFFDYASVSGDKINIGVGYAFYAVIITSINGVLLLVVLLKAANSRSNINQRRPYGLMLVATIFFTVSLGVLVTGPDIFPRNLLMIALGLDVALLGLALALMDAFDLGETLVPDMSRSLVYAGGLAVLFGGQIAAILAINDATGYITAQILLLAIGSAVIVQVFSTPVSRLLDRFVFRNQPDLQRERAKLRAAADALPRLTPGFDPAQMDENEFARLTRRAISSLGDLSKLASSPLARLPVIDARLAQRDAPDALLERANELKAVLIERIERLKPPGGGDFGTTDAWRHYNALYFPYVLGLKPYSRRAHHADLNPVAKSALDWFRAQVPERTLYNWQTSAARLIAQDLRGA